MSEFILKFTIFWGVWILVPVIIDGISTLIGLINYLFFLLKNRKANPPLKFHPLVSIIIPVKNGEKTLRACVESIASQDYPKQQLEVVIVDNGSTDKSYEIFQYLQSRLRIRLAWHSIIGRGKSWALNAGIHLTSGQYIMGLDCDVILSNDAVRRIIETLEANRSVGAVTANLVILPPPRNTTGLQKALASCEFLEYATVFGVGRTSQAFTSSLYTLSGACTAFRREALLSTFLYNKSTVSEDTDITFQLYERASKYKISIVPKAIVYLHPVSSLNELYAQRVRWQRGQLEVSAIHEELMSHSVMKLSGFSPARALLVDHTISFPRFVWMFFMPILLAFGYSVSMVVSAYILTYVFYLFIELIWYLAAFTFANSDTKIRLIKKWLYVFLMPLYRSMVFFFRFSGFLYVLSEPGTWGVSDPTEQVRYGVNDLRDWIKKKPRT
jgi:biofilm PGA synthesis N-glycosyltransferase PgaC